MKLRLNSPDGFGRELCSTSGTSAVSAGTTYHTKTADEVTAQHQVHLLSVRATLDEVSARWTEEAKNLAECVL